ncbi:MAG: hypothetical protein JSR84_19755 [Proteobacteria bacterium]|nr:hypothetical protein [Pseudomonadota bacterium]
MSMHRFDQRPEDPPRLPGFDVPFAQAIAWARERKAMLPAEFYGARLQADLIACCRHPGA